MKRPFETWDRFGIRHLILWTGAVAISIGFVKFFVVFEQAMLGGSNLADGVVYGFRYQNPIRPTELLYALAIGTLFGIGTPAAMARSTSIPFWKHPGRVLLALFVATASITLGFTFLGFSLFSGYQERSQILMQLGASSTYLVFALYALFRSRIGVLWRLSLLAWILVIILKICLHTMELAVPASSTTTLTRFVLILLGSQFLCAALILISGVVEILLRRVNDWRVWLATFFLPLYLFAMHYALIEVVYQAYRLNNL